MTRVNDRSEKGGTMWKTAEGSTGRLVQLCLCYFLFYSVYGVIVKWFQYGPPHMDETVFTAYSTVGGNLLCLGVVLACGWFRLKSNGPVSVGPLTVPGEFLYIVPSGVCTAVIIPTTTLLYSFLPVMVAMTIMRGGVIVIGRVVDELQIRQGILKKKVYWEENVSVVIALLAVAIVLIPGSAFGEHAPAAKPGDSAKAEFVKDPLAMGVLVSYLASYLIRIYIMNYYKNTRGKGVKLDNKGFFGVEQLSAFLALVAFTLVILAVPTLLAHVAEVEKIRAAVHEPRPGWPWAVLAGTVFGAVAFFSVFIFMFKGRTATFAGLVNRLTSLMAGTAATLLFAVLFDPTRYPKPRDWSALGVILVAVAFLTKAEMRRAAELAAAHEIEPPKPEPMPPLGTGEGKTA